MHQLLHQLGKTLQKPTCKRFELAFEEKKINICKTFHWLSKFENKVTSVKNAEYSGCPCMSKTDENVIYTEKSVHVNGRFTIHGLG
jgi:hypothetical protein